MSRDERPFERIHRPLTPQRTMREWSRKSKRAARREREYKAFIASPQWRQQKARIHERDGWQCTATLADGSRCPYTKADGPLHGHHERYHPRGIRYTKDQHIRTLCPGHHDATEKAKWWRNPRPY